MRVFVDRDLCHGSAEHAHRAPSVLASADGHRVVRPGRAGHERSGDDPSVPEAMKTCPGQAIGITGAPKSAPHRP
ncbi:ferredoxin [Streptomyces sp. NPDC046832]|uniref:ferredoxin n=1 Tax=Streptomyces sp. NPDC046832 TaxID=3155020 RepID=UPI0033D435B6